MKKEYDILVIGSGLGGLVSALVLAKEGLKVCVLEKNNQYGGNLQTFSRDKLIFDTGVHYLGGLSEGQNLNRFFPIWKLWMGLSFRKWMKMAMTESVLEMNQFSILMPRVIRISLNSFPDIFRKKKKILKITVKRFNMYAVSFKISCDWER